MLTHVEGQAELGAQERAALIARCAALEQEATAMREGFATHESVKRATPLSQDSLLLCTKNVVRCPLVSLHRLVDSPLFVNRLSIQLLKKSI